MIILKRFSVSVFLLIALSALFSFISAEAINGWHLRGSAPAKYEIGVEKISGKKVGYIKSIKKSITTKEFGTIMQSFVPKAYYGKKVKLTAMIQSKSIKGWAGMWMRVDGEKRKTLSFDNMQDRAIKGTKAWKKYEIVLDVPKESINVSYGVLIAGTGNIWVDNFKFEIIGNAENKKVKKVGVELTKPLNTGFEN